MLAGRTRVSACSKPVRRTARRSLPFARLGDLGVPSGGTTSPRWPCAGYRVHAPDLPGARALGCAAPAGSYALDAFADHIAALLDALELERPAMVAQSMGGRIALELARRHRVETPRTVRARWDSVRSLRRERSHHFLPRSRARSRRCSFRVRSSRSSSAACTERSAGSPSAMSTSTGRQHSFPRRRASGRCRCSREFELENRSHRWRQRRSECPRWSCSERSTALCVRPTPSDS